MPASKAALDAATGPYVGKEKNITLHAIIEYAGNPATNVVPDHVGQLCHDTSNDKLYWAHGLEAANWKALV